MPAQARWLLLGVLAMVSAAVGFVAGRESAPAAPSADVLRALEEQRGMLDRMQSQLETLSAREPRSLVAAATYDGVDLSAVRSELVKALREERGTACPEQAQEPVPPPPPPAPSPEALAAHREGLRMLEDAARSKRWTQADVEALRLHLDKMDVPHRQSITDQLIQMLNGGGYTVQVNGPPF